MYRHQERRKIPSEQTNLFNPTIYEKDLKQACIDAVNRLIENKQGVLYQLSENLTKAITLTDTLSPDAPVELLQRLI